MGSPPGFLKCGLAANRAAILTVRPRLPPVALPPTTRSRQRDERRPDCGLVAGADVELADLEHAPRRLPGRRRSRRRAAAPPPGTSTPVQFGHGRSANLPISERSPAGSRMGARCEPARPHRRCCRWRLRGQCTTPGRAPPAHPPPLTEDGHLAHASRGDLVRSSGSVRPSRTSRSQRTAGRSATAGTTASRPGPATKPARNRAPAPCRPDPAMCASSEGRRSAPSMSVKPAQAGAAVSSRPVIAAEHAQMRCRGYSRSPAARSRRPRSRAVLRAYRHSVTGVLRTESAVSTSAIDGHLNGDDRRR